MQAENHADFIESQQAKEIFLDVFAFFGTLSPDGFVKSLFGQVFERANVNPAVLVGQRFSETAFWQSSENTSSLLIDSINRAGKDGENTYLLLDFRISARDKIIIELNLHPLRGSEKEIREIFVCAKEVTKREQEIAYYKEKSENLISAAENAEIGLWYWDLVQNIIHSTPKCNELFEFPPDKQIEFESFLNILHPDDRANVEKALLDSQRYGREYKSEYRVVYKNGNINWVAARGRAFLNDAGDPIKMMGIVRKITDKKMASEGLSKVYEREKKARDEAEESNRAKDFFLAVVSHELRSPLNAILGWTKILLNKELDSETRQRALETIEKSARSQAKLLDDLLDSSRVASGRLKLEYSEIDLLDIVRTVHNLQKPTADAKQIELDISAEESELRVFGDANRLQQVISNLVSNALKFTPEGGMISVEARIDGQFASILVSDTGQGINAKSLPQIFQQFRQGDDIQGTVNHGGLGLGLSIAKILVEKHKGIIEAASDGTGKGSTFTVKIPLLATKQEVSKTAAETQREKKRALENIKIMIVEDDADSREVLQLFLEQNGAQVRSAESASRALEILEESPGDLPEVILSDLAMPGQDGYSLIVHLRTLPPEKGGLIPAIAVSAFSSQDNKQKASESGFQKYHTKPFEPDGIVEDILGLIRRP